MMAADTPEKPVPRQRVRSNPPTTAPAPEPRQRVRTRAVEAPAPLPDDLPRRPVHRLSDLSRPWSQLAGTELDPFESGVANPYNGSAVGMAGGGPIMGFMMKADDGRYAIYTRLRSGKLAFARWVSGSWHDAFHAVGEAYRAAKDGLHPPPR